MSKQISGESKLIVRFARIFSAAPTAGKTSFANQLKRSGVTVLDTDEIIKGIIPDFFTRLDADGEALHQSTDPGWPAMKKLMDAEAGRVATLGLRSDPKSVLVTNIWGPEFRSSIGAEFLVGGKLPLYVGLTPEAILARQAKRASDPSHRWNPKVVRGWMRSIEKYGNDAFARIVELDPEGYLSEAVDLSPLLAAMGINEIQPFEDGDRMENSLEAGSPDRRKWVFWAKTGDVIGELVFQGLYVHRYGRKAILHVVFTTSQLNDGNPIYLLCGVSDDFKRLFDVHTLDKIAAKEELALPEWTEKQNFLERRILHSVRTMVQGLLPNLG